MMADHARHSSVGRPPAAGLPAGIEPQEHVPPPTSARDLAVFEERLRSNLTYFRRRRQKYRLIQFALLLVALLSFYIGFLATPAPLLPWTFHLRTLFASTLVALAYIVFGRADYARTIDQARMFAPRVNRVLHHFNVAFARPGHPPELSFSKRIPIELVAQVDGARGEIQRRLRALQGGKKRR